MANINFTRYPGGKQKMLPIIMEHLKPLLDQQEHFIDLFVGGGSVLLEVAQQYPKHQLYCNDDDFWMASLWKYVAGPKADLEPLFKLMEQQPTIELFYKLRENPSSDSLEAAYRGIFFNRCTFSGISFAGPIGGREQKSKYKVDCRYNFNKLKKKILACNEILAGRTTVYCKDFAQQDQFVNTNYPVYIDPPYVHKGDALYYEKMSFNDHIDLNTLLVNRSNWVLSYDDCQEVRDLYQDNTIIDLAARYSINGKKDAWIKKNELIILP